MENDVFLSMAKWPNVPAVYHWLSLSRRGVWHLRQKPIRHPLSLTFISNNYEVDERGCWFFQNGPQRVFVALEYTPWVYRLTMARLETHTSALVHSLKQVILDDEENLLFETEYGIGVLHDADLLEAISFFGDVEGPCMNEDQTVDLSHEGLYFHFFGHAHQVKRMSQRQIIDSFDIILQPEPSLG